MNLPKVKLIRSYLKCATYGFIEFDERVIHTLELPDFDNDNNISCIPEGIYLCRWIKSPNLGWCYEVVDVFGRTYVRIHSGNFTRQIRGCILAGDSHKDIDKDGIPDVTNSVNTLNWMHNKLGDEFHIQIC